LSKIAAELQWPPHHRPERPILTGNNFFASLVVAGKIIQIQQQGGAAQIACPSRRGGVLAQQRERR
jgi:hypothetical protein